MRYRIDYQLTHDIDWFAIYQGIPIHVASNGNIIPNGIDSRVNREIQRYLATEIITKVEIEISDDSLNDIFQSTDRDFYLDSFIEFARKGFVSIDNHLEIDEQGNLSYTPIIVAYPQDRRHLFNVNRIPLGENLFPKIEYGDININLLGLWQ